MRSHLGLAGDCAIASIEDRGFDERIVGLDVIPERRIGKVELRDRVAKSGRTTGVTRGIVTRTGVTSNIPYRGVGMREIGGFEIRPDPEHLPSDGEVSSVVPLTVLDNGVGFGGALDFGEDILCRSCPDKGLGRLVARFQVLVDGGLEFGNTAEHAAADALLCQLAEPALDEIEPRRRRGNEVKVEAGVLREPLLHLLMLMRGVVVHDQMQLQRRWRFAIDLA